MQEIPRAEALQILSHWERQGTTISVMCFGSPVVFSSKSGRVAMCLDESLDLRFGDDAALRIFTADASFSTVGPEDFPDGSATVLPKFEGGIRIDFQDKQIQCCLLA
jgi:hypothetical protein